MNSLLLFLWPLLLVGGLYWFLSRKLKNRNEEKKTPENNSNIEEKVNGILAQKNLGQGLSKNEILKLIQEESLTREDLDLRFGNFEKKLLKSYSLSESTKEEVQTKDAPKSTDTGVKETSQKKETQGAVFYSGPPSKEGLFFGSKLTEHMKEGTSIYKVTISSSDSQKAQFVLVQNKEAITRAANLAGSYLLPACELSGSGDLKNARRISIKPGQLVRVNNNWKIARKAVISW